eukprot:6050881-Pleurochrysis_carterae.AAC.2
MTITSATKALRFDDKGYACCVSKLTRCADVICCIAAVANLVWVTIGLTTGMPFEANQRFRIAKYANLLRSCVR